MSERVIIASSEQVTKLHLVSRSSLAGLQQQLSSAENAWLRRHGYSASPGEALLLPPADDGAARALLGVSEPLSMWDAGDATQQLPEGDYQLAEALPKESLQQFALGWALGSYQFDRYRQQPQARASLVVEHEGIREWVGRRFDAIALTRDLVNTPTEDMGPEHLAKVAGKLAKQFGGKLREIVGAELLAKNFPAIHAVGRASHRPPRLIDLTWGSDKHPKLTLVGKGVCYDTGGLNIKPGAGMRDMKKDMGGSAHVLGLARLIMAYQLPVRLRVLIPAVENAIGPNSYRPGDVISTRKGLSVEIGNTDAEGRVVLGDALTYACEESPGLLIDFATLTGAARIALGPDLPPLYANRISTRDALWSAGDACEDPLWPMPLYAPYRAMLDSPVADISNNANKPQGGSLTAALYLQAFVSEPTDWVHMDVWAWNAERRPGRTLGGHAQGVLATFRVLQQRYARQVD
jgi:leucyl aminopeptidase